MPDQAEPLALRFGDYLLDRPAGALLRLHPDGRTSRVPLGGRAFRILCLLVERRGAIVTRQEIMDAVWPDVVVEENNLSVQLSNLRRALDGNGALGSCIQTLPARGYRFLPEATPVRRSLPDQAADPCVAEDRTAAGLNKAGRSEVGGAALDAAEIDPAKPQAQTAADPPAITPVSMTRRRGAVLIATASACVAVLFVWFVGRTPPPRTTLVAATPPVASVSSTATPVPFPAPAPMARPRLSVVVLPFNKFGNGVDDDMVDAITEDLTAAITRWHDWQVTAHNTALTYKGRPIDIRRVGEELGVRFAVTGSLRKRGTGLRVNLQLVSAETGAHLWADHFDAGPDADGYSVEDIIRHMALALSFWVADAESKRIAAESNPDAADSLTRARAALYGRPLNPENYDHVITLLEHAADLDPHSAVAQAALAEAQLDSINIWTDDPETPVKLRRAEAAVRRAEILAPDERLVMGVRVTLLLMQGRCAEVIAAARRASEAHPDLSGPHLALGICRMHEGRAAEAIPAFEQSIRVNPRNPAVYVRYHVMGYALLFLGRYDEAVAWLQKALAAHPGDSARNRGNIHAAIAAAQALAGATEEARRSAAEAAQLWPTLTARSYYPFNVSNPVAVAQIARLRDGLRLAGIRDHADVDADHNVAADAVLHSKYDSPTPPSAPGVRTIRTPELAALVQQRQPLMLDASNPWGQSIPAAIVLAGVGVGGSTSNEPQERLRRKMHQLTGGNLDAPIVALGWNAERFQSRNLALRLAALGYTEVYWYRGGREAWMAAGQPTAEVTVQDW